MIAYISPEVTGFPCISFLTHVRSYLLEDDQRKHFVYRDSRSYDNTVDNLRTVAWLKIVPAQTLL